MKINHVLLAAAGLVLANQAHAAPGCTAANLNGNYVMYQAAVNSNTFNHNGECAITILNGVLNGSCEFGVNSAGNPGFNGPVYGTAQINKNCSATMNIQFDPVPGVVHIDSDFDLQFTPNKESFVGKFGNQFGVQGITNGTRVSPLLPATPAN